jgi:uncharacterized protein involved in exopolysaccharide biosynthesis
MNRFGWKGWMLAATLIGAAAGLFTAARAPKLYRSEALLQVVPQRIPESYVRSAVTATMTARLQSLGQVILSRTSLESIIQEFGLYAEERRHAVMEDVVRKFRKDVDIAPQSDSTFRVSFVGGDARKVQQVVQKLTLLIIQENVQNRALLAEQTDEFLKSQLSALRSRLIEQKQELDRARQSGSPQAETLALEYDVLQTTFKDLLTKQEESYMAANLERRQIGETFILIDPARLAETPVSPDRRIYAGVGAAAGLAVACLLSFVVRWTRSRGKMQPRAVPVEA